MRLSVLRIRNLNADPVPNNLGYKQIRFHPIKFTGLDQNIEQNKDSNMDPEYFTVNLYWMRQKNLKSLLPRSHLSLLLVIKAYFI